MYHRQLVAHVSARLREGADEETLKTELRADGWSADDVREAFYYSAYPEKLLHFSLARLLHSEVPTAVSALLLIGVLAASAGALVFFRAPILNYTINLAAPPEAPPPVFSYGEQRALSDPDFFSAVRQQFIDDRASFIEADLTTMSLRVYRVGELALSVPIVTKGREGSWWETPAGLYKVQSKERTHFSSIGRVYMPWSMNFQGNFFIHGDTYYPDGTSTNARYTGGCIRLASADAEQVYALVNIGAPVLVFERSFSPDAFVYDDTRPPLAAPLYLAADLGNNYVFAAQGATTTVPIASLTKLLTALVATEYINLDMLATVPSEALVYTSRPRLIAGERRSVYGLLFPLLLESSNEAAETIARFYGRDSFITRMNEKAAAIGMQHSRFVDPSGAEAGNVSTAEDLFLLAKYLYYNRSFVLKISSGALTVSAYGGSGFVGLSNLNTFVGSEFFFGGKNGKTTAAHETNLSVFELPVGGAIRPVVVVVLGSPDEKVDSHALMEYVVNHL